MVEIEQIVKMTLGEYDDILVPICRAFEQGGCRNRSCVEAHCSKDMLIQKVHGFVEVCNDFRNGRCNRDNCKYFHPPEEWDHIDINSEDTVPICEDFSNNMCLRPAFECMGAHPHADCQQNSVCVTLCASFMETNGDCQDGEHCMY